MAFGEDGNWQHFTVQHLFIDYTYGTPDMLCESPKNTVFGKVTLGYRSQQVCVSWVIY